MSALRPGGSTRAWRRLRLACLVRDRWSCRVPVDAHGFIDPAGRPCGLPADRADHVIPRARGGRDELDNLRASCERHNLEKGDRLDEECAARRRAAPDAPARPTPPVHPIRPRAWEW